MNRNDFLNMIEHSGPSDRHMIGEINDLINVFPYFQSAYMMLLKGLQNTSDVKFENQLRSNAMHIADREVLYYFLKSEPAPVSDKEQEKEIVPQAVFKEDEPDTGQTVIESARNSDDLIHEIEKSTRENNDDVSEQDHNVLIYSDQDMNDPDAAVFIVDEESGAIEEKVIYMDPGFSFSENPDLLELDSEEPGDMSQIPELQDELDKRSEIKPDIKQVQADLIDKFIIANPRIEPSREKAELPNEDISKPFVEAKDGFVTETLARIYIRQGYYSRAIDIYEKLSLKFPEKSSYFASQIEKVKEYLKK
jgi:hypothetical protein